ncbi:MAG: hypothetical protein WCV99_18910 [Sterolibacterium sp.]
MILVLIGTPLALGTGNTDVTVGASPALALVPKMGSCPPPPHAAKSAVIKKAMSQRSGTKLLWIPFIFFPFSIYFLAIDGTSGSAVSCEFPAVSVAA